MIRDWANKDAEAFHYFLWSQHLGYAKSYEEVHSFGKENLVLTRRILFQALKECLLRESRDSLKQVQSVFDVGCSAGYLLRFVETELFPSANSLEGIDIDKHAIDVGTAYLRSHESKIRLTCADMANLEQIIDERKYDVVLCAGVLTYVNERTATDLVRAMLNHCNRLVAIKGIAHPVLDNGELGNSYTRRSDGAFIHNFDAMVKEAGGSIVYRRWEGAKLFDGQTLYLVFGQPGKQKYGEKTKTRIPDGSTGANSLPS
jgi:SAM-dependent methyltransferase